MTIVIVKLQINNKLLSDSPFSESNKNLFTPPHPSSEDLIQDIKNGTPTCYLISGYRGAGKSSFIKRIEHRVKDNSKTTNSVEVIFVHINFSRYQSQTFLLRKLIRGLYLEIKNCESFKTIKSKELKMPFEQRSVLSLEDLYEKTFYDTSYNITKSDKKEVITVFNIDIWALIKVLLPGVFFLLIIANWILNLFPLQFLINILGSVFTFGMSLKGVVDIKHSISKSNLEQKDFNRKSMYDDEIADHHFFSVLKTLQDNHYKVIFVLDELDKVDDDDIDNLLKEMKPYLVSGAASFIAVAGQNLFYKYMQAKSIDDDVLSSIFSKFVHIPLFTREEFRDLFERIVINKPQNSEEEKKLLNSYIDYFTFESRGVPRKFISLVRQELKWEEDSSFIEIEQTEEELKKYTQILDILEKIDDEEIEAEGFDDGLHDYFLMQLYIRSHKILFSKKLNFSRNEILEINGEQ